MLFIAPVVSLNHHLFLSRCPSRRDARRLTATRNGDEQTARQKYLDEAARDFSQGIEAGLTPDEIVRLQMGVESEDELTDAQRRYKTKIISKLERRAAELERQKGAPCVEFEMAKAAYGRGSYPTCCDLLEKAALEHNENSILGGEIRLWLALTYQALGKTKECVELFRRLEDHPNKKTRRQAKDLLYIIEAPKLRIGEDERVELPVLKDLERAPPRMSISRTRSRQTSRRVAEREKTFEESFWEDFQPPIVLRNRYVQAAFVAIALCLAVYSGIYRSR